MGVVDHLAMVSDCPLAFNMRLDDPFPGVELVPDFFEIRGENFIGVLNVRGVYDHLAIITHLPPKPLVFEQPLMFTASKYVPAMGSSIRAARAYSRAFSRR